MVDLGLTKVTAPDFIVSIRESAPSLVVIDKDAVPKTYWELGKPRLRRQILTHNRRSKPKFIVQVKRQQMRTRGRLLPIRDRYLPPHA